jgi:simple sugar transport system ATP-binding protein
VQGLSDRLAVIHDGQIMDTVDPETVTEEQIGLLMGGEYPDDWEAETDRSVGGDAESESESLTTDSEGRGR